MHQMEFFVASGEVSAPFVSWQHMSTTWLRSVPADVLWRRKHRWCCQFLSLAHHSYFFCFLSKSCPNSLPTFCFKVHYGTHSNDAWLRWWWLKSATPTLAHTYCKVHKSNEIEVNSSHIFDSEGSGAQQSWAQHNTSFWIGIKLQFCSITS